MIEIDGNFLEGGGSIVRIALALSTVTGKAVRIKNIRANRPEPGLKNQHLYAVKTLRDMCDAKTSEYALGETELTFIPGKLKGGTFKVDMETAGSIPLFLQAVMLPAMFANRMSTFEIIGGTDGKWAPPIDYVIHVLLPHLQKYADIHIEVKKRGYFPKGQGEVICKVKPKHKLSDFKEFQALLVHLHKEVPKINVIEQGKLMSIKGISHASFDLDNNQVAERQAKAAEIELSSFNCIKNTDIKYANTASTGSGIVLWAVFSKDESKIEYDNPVRLGGDMLGARDKKAEQVGIDAASALKEAINSGAAVDAHLADMLLPYMALASNSKMKVADITDHTRTNIHVIEQFFGKKFVINDKTNVIVTLD